MRLYLHPVRTCYFDYGDHLETVLGYMWSSDGKAESACCYEPALSGSYAERLAEARRKGEGDPPCEVLEGEPVVRRFDVNPHGAI